MNMNKKRIVTWGAFILGLVILLFGLAKLGAKSSGNITTASSTLLAPVTDSDWFKGSAKAPHSIVEYSDFQCPACASYYPLIKRLTDEYPNEVRVVYRHFPLEELHKNAKPAAIAAEAAGKQGKFFEMHDALFNTQDQWAKDGNPELTFEDLAGSLGMNGKQFKEDVNNPELKKRVEENISQAVQNGIGGTPTLFLDGKLIQTPNSYEELVQLVVGKK